MPTNVSAEYDVYNSQSTKNVSLVLKINGLSDVLSNRTLYTRLRYGDPVSYGDAGLVYGGLRPITSGVQPLMSLEGSSLTISQRLEPEQGRAAVSMVTLSFIDLDNYMTKLISPGIVLDDILGKDCTLSLGYQEISYPEDFTVIFRGKITAVQSASGLVTLQFSDPNVVRKENVFFTAKTKLNGAINSSVTTINVAANGDFHKSILGPLGTYDAAVSTYMKIEDEFVEYGPSATVPTGTFGTNTFTNCIRGSRGTIAASHADGADVQAFVQLNDNVMNMALKIMLSGWGGFWKSSIPILNIVQTGDPILLSQAGSILFPSKTDVVRDYGLAIGEYLTLTGATNGVNNQTTTVTRIADFEGEPNRLVYTASTTLVAEISSPALIAIRSAYDTYPSTCGAKLNPNQVSIQDHVDLKNQFMGTTEYNFKFLIDAEQSAKSFIESQLFLPTSAYSLTKQGRLSAGLTHPPIADETLIYLDQDTILDPAHIKISRATNNRKFFNEIDYTYDFDDTGTSTTTNRYLDSDSISIIDLNTQLPIQAKGGRTSNNFQNIVDRTSKFLLSRYKRGAALVDLKVNWQAGSKIESGDIVGLTDGGTLQISNFQTGTRDLGSQLWEVQNRSLDIRSGTVSLQLVSGLGTDLTDRYATWSPSSVVSTGSTTTTIVFQDSYGAIYPGDEQRKWRDYVGQSVLVHSPDFSILGTTVIQGFDTTNPYRMLVSPALGFTPASGYIIDIDSYPTSTDPTVAQIYKTVHVFFDASVVIVSGISTTQFTVGAGDIAKFTVGFPVRVHNTSFTIDSTDTDHFITNINTGTNTITVGTSLGFTPAAGQRVEILGFADGKGGYRWI